MDVKQLKYFISCAEAGSISEAAKTLYSTQSSVSKVIKTLEDSLGIQLFERLPRGICLTAQGKRVYHYACKIINEMNVLEKMAGQGMTKWMRIATNPSTWFSDQFVDFYNENYEKNYHFQITTAGVRTVMERVRDYLDDIGFVYILEGREDDFRYELSRNKLFFSPLQKTDIILYPGKENQLFRSEKEKIRLEETAGMRLIQNYEDEFFDIRLLVNADGDQKNGINVSVLTNSDSIMKKMLENSNVINIGGSYLMENQHTEARGIPVDAKDQKVIFGYILHKNEEPDESILELLEFLKGRVGSCVSV